MKSENQFSQDKKALRKYIKEQRSKTENKAFLDDKICRKFLSTELYKNAKTVLAYCSLPDEINTDIIIKTALSDGKRVAVPYCIDNMGNMTFYYINSFDDLHIGSFGVREPDINECEEVIDFDGAVIVLPGLCFDENNYRLGYGKGYYDRFLKKHSLISVGLCYNNLILKKVPTDIYDKRADFVITEFD